MKNRPGIRRFNRRKFLSGICLIGTGYVLLEKSGGSYLSMAGSTNEKSASSTLSFDKPQKFVFAGDDRANLPGYGILPG